jgi:hypothetical protein
MRQLLSLAVLVACGLVSGYADEKKPADTPKAAKMRKLLKTKKISVEFKNTRLQEAMDEIKEEAKGFGYLLDRKGGVSVNLNITYSAKNKTIEQILDGMFKKNGLGYIVISKKGHTYDGMVQVRQGKERGYPKKK